MGGDPNVLIQGIEHPVIEICIKIGDSFLYFKIGNMFPNLLRQGMITFQCSGKFQKSFTAPNFFGAQFCK